MLHGKCLLLFNLCRRFASSSVFYFATNLPDGWLDRIIGIKLLQFYLRSPSMFATCEAVELKIANLISLPPDHPYIQMELDEVSDLTLSFREGQLTSDR
jgi:hypothetical protein